MVVAVGRVPANGCGGAARGGAARCDAGGAGQGGCREHGVLPDARICGSGADKKLTHCSCGKFLDLLVDLAPPVSIALHDSFRSPLCSIMFSYHYLALVPKFNPQISVLLPSFQQHFE